MIKLSDFRLNFNDVDIYGNKQVWYQSSQFEERNKEIIEEIRTLTLLDFVKNIYFVLPTNFNENFGFYFQLPFLNQWKRLSIYLWSAKKRGTLIFGC